MRDLVGFPTIVANSFVRFNVVAAIGVLVQLALLTLLTKVVGLSYLWASGLAVALTVLHNFVWHESFTFYKRLGGSRQFGSRAARFLKFNLLTGVISIGGNVLLIDSTMKRTHLPLAAANLLAIAICGVANYFANERLVFRHLRNMRGRHSFFAEPGQDLAQTPQSFGQVLFMAGKANADEAFKSIPKL
jgi:putative flippase GtrA